jgi:ADP-ribose pyrophosphatase
VAHEVREIFTGRVFRVTVEPVTLPGGHRLDAELVRHHGSVVLVPITDEGAIILVRQFRPSIGAVMWELPAGRIEPGEDLEAAARRECHEEIDRLPSRLERLGGSLLPTPGFCDERIAVFRATGMRAPGPGDPVAVPDADEDIEVRAFSRAELEAMVRAGEIIDLKTVAALALLDLYR